MFDKLLKAAIGTVLLPIAIVADVVTIGGNLNDRDEPYIASRVKQIYADIDEALDDKGPH